MTDRSPFGTITLICNSRSGNGGVGKALPEVEKNLKLRELPYEVFHTEGPGHASQLAREALDRGSRFIVAVGGDGTVHEVVNGMIVDDKAVNPEAVLGVVAAGSGCDFIKTFGIPAMPAHAVSHLDGDESFAIDIGKVTFMKDGVETTRYFPNIAEVGIGAATVGKAARMPRWMGPTIYFFAFWLTLFKHKSANVVVDLVDKKYEGPMNNMVVANGQFFGGGMKIAPEGRSDRRAPRHPGRARPQARVGRDPSQGLQGSAPAAPGHPRGEARSVLDHRGPPPPGRGRRRTPR